MVVAALAMMALSIPQAKQAIRADAKLDHPKHVWVDRCRREGRRRVRCRLTEEVVEEREGVVLITALEGAVTVTLRNGVERVHRD